MSSGLFWQLQNPKVCIPNVRYSLQRLRHTLLTSVADTPQEKNRCPQRKPSSCPTLCHPTLSERQVQSHRERTRLAPAVLQLPPCPQQRTLLEDLLHTPLPECFLNIISEISQQPQEVGTIMDVSFHAGRNFGSDPLTNLPKVTVLLWVPAGQILR